MADDSLKLSVVIPAHDEEGSIEATIASVTEALDRESIEHEVVVVDDASRDRTGELVGELGRRDPRVRCVEPARPGGFGLAVRAGLEAFEGDAVAIVMADGSDDPEDLISYFRVLEEGYDCAFGSRFIRGGSTSDYPWVKLVLNRLVNSVIKLLFAHGYNDTTNAFKAYRREVVEHVGPLLSEHFNLTVEMPLKAIIRGYSYAIVPVGWRNRSAGQSKFDFREMGSRYLFIVLYAFLEHHLSRGDYRRPGTARRWRTGTPGVLRAERDRDRDGEAATIRPTDPG